MNHETRPKLLQRLIEELEKGRKLLFGMDDDLYVRASNTSGSIGGHFRHDLNFVDAVISGIETGVIDYNRRVRDPLMENKRLYAAEKFAAVIMRLEALDTRALSKQVLICSEVDPAVMHPSSISRELEFVYSHTVHHHAIIAEKLAAVGIETARYFGVAPSTLEYWKTIQA